MLTHIETLVAGIYDEGVVQQAMLPKVVHESAHILVQALRYLGIVTHVTLVLPVGHGFVLGTLCAVAPHLGEPTEEVARETVVEGPVLLQVLLVQTVHVVQVVLGESAGITGQVSLVVVDEVHVML